MKTPTIPTLLSSLCLLVANPANSQTTPATPAPASASSSATGMATSGTSKTSLSTADVTFMKRAAESGHLEVEGSTLAGGKAGSDAVKAFAKQMVDDHTKANQELVQLASTKNVKLPERPSLTERAKLKMLGSSSSTSFDKKYAASIGMAAHTEAVKLFEKAARDVKDPDVKSFATKTLPALQHHLEMAKQLKATVDTAPDSAKSGA